MCVEKSTVITDGKTALFSILEQQDVLWHNSYKSSLWRHPVSGFTATPIGTTPIGVVPSRRCSTACGCRTSTSNRLEWPWV